MRHREYLPDNYFDRALQSAQIIAQLALPNLNQPLYRKWGTCWKKQMSLDIGSNFWSMLEKWIDKMRRPCSKRQRNWSLFLFHQLTPQSETQAETNDRVLRKSRTGRHFT